MRYQEICTKREVVPLRCFLVDIVGTSMRRVVQSLPDPTVIEIVTDIAVLNGISCGMCQGEGNKAQTESAYKTTSEHSPLKGDLMGIAECVKSKERQ